jgi:flagellar biosynthesis protein FlhG
MNDQAEGLRNMVRNSQEQRPKQTRVITVTSGKGGVGKSNFTLNFALKLKSRGYDVLIFDADIGLANIDVLMGVSPQYHLHHLLTGQKTIEEIVCLGTNGLQFIAGGSGFNDLLNLSAAQLDFFVREVGRLHGKVDFILFDTGAGLSNETLKFIVSANETIIVTTPEPTAITDAYAIVKMVSSLNYRCQFRLVINRVTSPKEGQQTAEKISMVAKRFLGLDIATLGYVADDLFVSKAVKKQMPFTVAFPQSAASKNLEEIVSRFLAKPVHTESEGMKGFLNKMIKLLRK